jgi:hypothetical protein
MEMLGLEPRGERLEAGKFQSALRGKSGLTTCQSGQRELAENHIAIGQLDAASSNRNQVTIG